MTTATATVVIFFSTTANILRNFHIRKSLFTYVKVQIVIMLSQLTIFLKSCIEWNLQFNLVSQVFYTYIFLIHIIFLNFIQFLIKLQIYLITATATAVVNFGTTALEPQPQFSKIPQVKQEPQPRYSKNSQPIHHYMIHRNIFSIPTLHKKGRVCFNPLWKSKHIRCPQLYYE